MLNKKTECLPKIEAHCNTARHRSAHLAIIHSGSNLGSLDGIYFRMANTNTERAEAQAGAIAQERVATLSEHG